MPGKIHTCLKVVILGLIIILPSCSAPGAAVTPVEEDTRTALPAAKQVEPTSTSPGIENSLKLFAPLPGEEITGTVTVHGEGRAFENTILAEVRAGGATLGRNIVTTTADIGQVAEFTTTIRFEPVTVETEGVVIIYTESAKDGSIDQSASVRVRLLPGDIQPTRAGGQPFIKITPPSGNGGTSVLVQGTGFPDGEVIEIRIGGLNTSATSEAYANVTAGKGGAFSTAFLMPVAWPNGDPILSPQVVVLASSSDFVHKASALFDFSVAPLPQHSPGARK